MQARNVGPFPLVENSTAIDDHVDMIVELTAAVVILDGYLPLTIVVRPRQGSDFVAKLDVLVHEIVILRHTLNVLPDLRRVRIIARPWFHVPIELIDDTGNIAGTSRISRVQG